MTAFTYLLRCSDGSFYVGSTTHIAARMFQHQEGRGAEYTKRRRPVELVWFEEHQNVLDAFGREKQIRKWSRAKRIALIEGRYADLPALSRRPESALGTGFKPRSRNVGWVRERDIGTPGR